MDGLVVLLIVLGAYFFPTIVGTARKKHNAGAIFVLNLLLGWTVVGWVIALVWALTHDASRPSIDDRIPAVSAGEVCPQCKSVNLPGAAFCSGCGQNLVAALVEGQPEGYCTRCGQALAKYARFCSGCGQTT